jgi:hypothetical protein
MFRVSSSDDQESSTRRVPDIVDQFGFAVMTKGEELVNKGKDDDKQRQIFPFNPYIAYGPFLSIPLWILVGMYSKLLGEIAFECWIEYVEFNCAL